VNERTAIVTGASAGIGLWTARHLAAAGFRVGLVCRDERRAEVARERVAEATPGAAVDVWIGDLSRGADVRDLAAKLRARHAAIDVLVNNAGAVFGTRSFASDGTEMHLATNYVGHFVLTALLLDRLIAAPSGRILGLASSLHVLGRMRYRDPGFARWYHLVPAYAQSKLAIVLFTLELARRARHLALGVHCADPGFVATRITDGAGPIHRQMARPLGWFGREPSEAGAEIARLAADPSLDGTTGLYFATGRVRAPGRRVRDPRAGAAWWEHSQRWLTAEEAATLRELLQPR
jgi:retinol dehydrogenase 14